MFFYIFYRVIEKEFNMKFLSYSCGLVFCVQSVFASAYPEAYPSTTGHYSYGPPTNARLHGNRVQSFVQNHPYAIKVMIGGAGLIFLASVLHNKYPKDPVKITTAISGVAALGASALARSYEEDRSIYESRANFFANRGSNSLTDEEKAGLRQRFGFEEE